MSSNWPGIEITLDNQTGLIYAQNADSRETENIPINSAYAVYDPSTVINLWDGQWHNLVYCWSIDDVYINPNAASVSFQLISGSVSTSALNKGILMIDGYIIGNRDQGTPYVWPGKQTPMSFLFDQPNGKGTFFAIGARTLGSAATSLASSTLVDQVFSGEMQRVVIWDRPLTSSNNFNLGIDSLFAEAGGRNGFLGPVSDMLGNTQNIGDPNTSSSLWDPLSGTYFKSFSGNVVAYYKFDELGSNVNTVIDYSGTAAPLTSGAQKNTASGNPLTVIGVLYDSGDYLVQDIPTNSIDEIMQTGILSFEDELLVHRPIGFINYDLGEIVFDAEYNNSGSGLPLLSTMGVSGLTLNASQSATNFYIKSISFSSQQFVERLMINVSATADEMNVSENPTSVDVTTGLPILNPTAGYVTAVGLFNDKNEMLAVAKLNEPIRKDEDHNIVAQIKLDF